MEKNVGGVDRILRIIIGLGSSRSFTSGRKRRGVGSALSCFFQRLPAFARPIG